MTVIAAAAGSSHVVMGCDTAASHGLAYVYKREGKIIEVIAGDGGKILIGAAGNGSILPTIRRNLAVDATPGGDDDTDEWADRVAVAITEILSDAVPSLIDTSDGTAAIDGVVLLAWREHLWLVHTSAAIRPNNNLVAVGSGGDVATGALTAALKFGADPKSAVTTAVEAACTFADGCRLDERGPLIHHT